MALMCEGGTLSMTFLIESASVASRKGQSPFLPWKAGQADFARERASRISGSSIVGKLGPDKGVEMAVDESSSSLRPPPGAMA